MNILDTIIASKRREVEAAKKQVTVADLENQPLFAAQRASLKQSLLTGARTGIIAEFKRRSPSKGAINEKASVADVVSAYDRFGASGISVLTDQPFFGGSPADLQQAAHITRVPLLRKDFVVDPYQLIEARAWGASVILLIAACLSPAEVKTLAEAARRLELEVLLEIHAEAELAHICPEVHLVGVNNRNLKTFGVDLEQSVRLAEKIGNDFPRIAESGITSVQNLLYLQRHGFSGFLVGEHFMRAADPGQAFQSFTDELKTAGTHEN